MAKRGYTWWYEQARSAIESIGQAMPDVPYHTYMRRNAQLRRDGFLWKERFWLAAHDIESPAMQLMREERRDLKAEYLEYFSWNQFQVAIARMYHENSWYFRRGGINPFAMLEEYKRRYNMPDTPQARRKVIEKDYHEAKTRTIRRFA